MIKWYNPGIYGKYATPFCWFHVVLLFFLNHTFPSLFGEGNDVKQEKKKRGWKQHGDNATKPKKTSQK